MHTKHCCMLQPETAGELSQCLAVESDGINFYIVCKMDNTLAEKCSRSQMTYLMNARAFKFFLISSLPL